MKQIHNHPFSGSACHLTLLSRPEGVDPYVLSGASGFIWEKNNEYYLITNWHVVTGRNYQTGELLDANGGVPHDILLDQMYFHQNNKERKVPHCELYDDDDRPTWFKHPVHKEQVDIVAIRIHGLEGLNTVSINTLQQQDNMQAVVGGECFVLGYPLGKTPFPIWKRASIASEPEYLKFDFINSFYIDTATRAGMSGGGFRREVQHLI